MRRYWIEKEKLSDGDVMIDGETFRHIHSVCRQNEGDKFEVLTGDGKAYLVEVTDVQKKKLSAKVIDQRDVPALQKPFIHLVLSLPRFPVFEAVLEKSVELGVKTVHPVVSDFSFLRTADGVSDERRRRWEKIVLSATQQSGRGELLNIANVGPLESFLEEFNRKSGAAGLFSYEGAADKDIRSALKALNSPQEIFLFVGSEGGFSHREVELFQGFGLTPVTLGAQVLRVETACVTLISVLKYQFGLLSSSEE